ncbi:hypothetical protein K443DRAFT_624764 [Laccaria amethystina LaAM-08-1]|uniref:Unplaced genomic scaffold K443scaffold_117, whole genome shotgun sequence n=1 Tax=Laccaria amethystina LaAM-08-1 TaxID=1095629 RepID=A0A0C9WNK1_9AGAR|nr:hypothetical protein K443DRAFT_624764 [Laccaria amethystina LaAM-08-1]
MRLSHQLSRSFYSRERPPPPSPGLTANHSSKNGQPSTLLWKSTPGPSLPKHSSGSTTSWFMRAVQHTPKAAKPARYTKDLCPLPSTRRPHVLASERLQCWIPLCGRESAVNPPSNLAPDDIRQIAIVMGKSWEESTLAAYGSGLLNFHVYCDQKSIPEDQRAPASPVLIHAFISALAGAYSGSTIDNYVYGIRAWHLIHGVKWQMEVAELEALLRAAEKTTPATSRRKKRMDKPRDAAVYSCLTTAFYATARLGEFTVPNLKAFDPNTHVKPSDVRIEVDRNGLRSTVFHIPKTKTSPHGEDVSWSKQADGTDPEAALAHHMAINKPPADGHLFSYLKDSRFRPLTKTEFTRTVAEAARKAGLDPRQGHGIRIGSTLEYLLRGTPFEVMKVKGRWASDAFLIYLTKHAQILAPYMQAVPEVHECFIKLTMLHIRR